MEPSIRKPFEKLNYIKKSLQNKDIYPALEWAKENRSQLEAQVIIKFINKISKNDIIIYCYMYSTFKSEIKTLYNVHINITYYSIIIYIIDVSTISIS